MLYLDFTYLKVRCREQTALNDTAENRKRVQALLNRILKEIAQGTFDYEKTFPGSPRANLGKPQELAGSQPDPATRTDVPRFDDFSVTWRAEMAPQWRRQHHKSVDTIFDAHLLPTFGECSIAAIARPDILDFRAHLAALPGRTSATLSPVTINKIMGILRQCITEATERYELPDVFKGIRRLRAPRSDVQPFSLDEVDKIRSTIRADYRNYVTVRFFTGLRTGEINGLKWKYVDFDSNVILIRETYSAGETEKNAKTQTSIRDIPMLPMVKSALLDQWQTRDPDSEYVFCSSEGNPIDAHNFANRVWYPLLRYLDITKRRPYETRHTTATLMLAAGESPEWIARLMGHANTQMLFTVYSRFVPNLTRQDGRAITGLLNSRVNATEPPPVEDLSTMSREQLEALLRSMTTSPTKENRRAR